MRLGYSTAVSVPTPARLARSAAFLAAALALGHALVFLANYGAGSDLAAAMSRTGHDGYWTDLAVGAGLAVGFFALLATVQVLRLWRAARSLQDGRVIIPDAGLGRLAALLARRWASYGSVTVLAFLAQENLEHLASGLGLPGLAVLWGPGYAGAFAILVASALLAGLVDALLDWCRTVLIARIRASARAGRRHGVASRPAGSFDLPRLLLTGRPAGRAPPSLLSD